ncbi:VIR-like CYIR protein, partial [Plasmodium cynomolgi strain B]
MLFTYFKKYDSIKTSMGDMKQGECNKYFAYINHINSLYKAYKDYFDCNDKYDPSSLLPLVEHCKTIEPRTPEHIEHGTSEEHTELEDSGSEDEAGSRSDVVEHD